MKTFTCTDCKREKPTRKENGWTNYGTDQQGQPICTDCCGVRDWQEMKETGRAILYLNTDTQCIAPQERPAPGWEYLYGTMGGTNKYITCSHVSNWPGTLRFNVDRWQMGKHNLARFRIDVWFTDSQGQRWHGTTYGEDTQLCHCKRLKS